MNSAMISAALANSLLMPMPIAAQTPPGISDLVGTRAAGGETQLEARGWTHIKTEKGDDRAWSYWWQPQRRECVTVAVMDSRFDSITTSPAADCNQSATKSKGSDAGSAAAAAVAIVGIAALAHSSHHHKDGKHLGEADDDQYGRGYRDGLYSQSYHNCDRSDAYSDGYTRGTEQRGHETGYRDGQGSGAGYAPAAKVNDLLTMRAASADVELQKRGFRTGNAYQAGDTSYTIRANDRTGQCV
ncbi:hypothetical protein GGC65_001577 [Sphingopyxis sp. OAS728]|uniref:hypothetical protein n=1 Tax=Sphingopyxis sp. OAS728 TaxID=2663823 RepID=UPI00178BC5DC|nr:hypothetical protein [Sphingopyxis sp. OAS728]MBE1527121.1 hypothetical protein [Sphingopyxis sp. OAS728]